MANVNNPSPSIDEFVDRLVEAKGLIDLDEEVLIQVKKDLSDRVEDRINAAILAKIPADKLEFFEKLIEQADENEIHLFCEKNIPNMAEVLAAELADFQKTYLSA